MAWRTATGEDGPEFSGRPGPQPTAHTKPRSGARVGEDLRRGTGVTNSIEKLRAIAKVLYKLINVSPVVKDLKRA